MFLNWKWFLMNSRRLVLLGLIASGLIFLNPSLKARETPRDAPQWEISEWLNGEGTTIDKLKGRVVIVDFFQLWCPGCNKFSIPLLKYWEGKFADEIAAEKLVVVSIHTVFEGHNYQTTKRLKKFLKKKGITHLVGIDRHADGAFVPMTMRRYRTRGTPEMAFIDKSGKIRFQNFGFFEPDAAEALLRTLLAE